MNLKKTLIHEFYRFSVKLIDLLLFKKNIVSQTKLFIILIIIRINFKLLDSKSKLKIENNSELSLFKIINKSNEYYFSELGRVWGFIDPIERGYSLAKSYGLDSINIDEGDVIIDVGANIGDLTLYLRNLSTELRESIKYFGIEPGRREFECLKRNAELCNFKFSKVFNLAASNNNGVETLFYTPKTADSSLVEPPEWDEKVSIQVRTLESLLQPFISSIKKIKFLKCEAEGSELEVLEGLGDVLDKVEFIAADLGFERGLEQRSTAPEVIPYLMNKGFKLIKLTQPQCCRYLFKNERINY